MANDESHSIDKCFLSPEQAGEYAGGTSRVTVDRWIRHGRDGRPPLPAIKIGRKVLIERQTLHDWLMGARPLVPRGRGRPRKYP